jgi:TRAP-type C4-dicarboxylate transport system substrate-binding protein
VKRVLFFYCCFVAVMLLAGCTIPATAREKTIQLKLSTHHPERSFLVQRVIIPWKESIERNSNERVQITLYAGETLVKMQDEYDALVSGLSDIADIAPGVTPNRFQLAEIDTLPMLFTSASVVGKVHTELMEKYCIDRDLGKVKYLFDICLPPMQFFLNKPVRKLEDMNGLKMRIEGKVEGWTMEALKATGVLISTGETSIALEKKLIDGCALVWEGALVFGVPQVTRYRLQCDIYTRAFPLIMNKNSWNRLPLDIKKIFEEQSGSAASMRYGAIADGAMNDAKRAVMDIDKKAGNPDIIVLSNEERDRWQKMLMSVRDRWVEEKKAQGLPAGEMLNEALRLMEQYSN